MRLFTAIDLPDDVLQVLEDLLAKLRPTAPIQWSPPANMHITTKFIGEWPEARLEELMTALAGVRSQPAIMVEIRSLIFFPTPRSPRVFSCGIEAPGLEDLAAATERVTANLGIAGEKRSFSPHLTLARIKERVELQPLHKRIAALSSLEFGRFTVKSFFLYQSKLRPSGSVYTKLREFPFAQP